MEMSFYDLIKASKLVVEEKEPVLIEKSVTENGTYTAADDEADGYSSVTVNVSGSGPEHYISYDAFDASGDVTEASIVGFTEVPYSALYGNRSLQTVNMQSGLTAIGGNAFYYCENLTLTSLPYGIKSIGEYAFYECESLSITELPPELTKIDIFAFKGCTGLQELTFNSKPNIAKNAFNNCTNLTTINVPWSEGEVANAPWGATNATINYNYVPE